MLTISIDPGRHAGWALFQDHKNLLSYGTIYSDKPATARAKMKLMRQEFRTLFTDMRRFLHPEIHFIIEGVFIGPNNKTALIQKSIQQAIMDIAEDHDFIVHKPIMPSEWQCHIGVDKKHLEQWVKNTYPNWPGGCEHQRDAIAMGYSWLYKKWEQEMLQNA